jgi:hypothetical protein
LVRRSPGLLSRARIWGGRGTLTTMVWCRSDDDVQALLSTGVVARPDESTDRHWTRVLAADPVGFTNGVWRAEGNVLAHIENFTPLSRETDGPPVVRKRQDRGQR